MTDDELKKAKQRMRKYVNDEITDDSVRINLHRAINAWNGPTTPKKMVNETAGIPPADRCCLRKCKRWLGHVGPCKP